MHKIGISQVKNSTRGRFQSNMAEKLTKSLMFPLDVHPQGTHGWQKNKTNIHRWNFLVLGATMQFKRG